MPSAVVILGGRCFVGDGLDLMVDWSLTVAALGLLNRLSNTAGSSCNVAACFGIVTGLPCAAAESEGLSSRGWDLGDAFEELRIH